MAESESSSSEHLKSKITCKVNLETDEIEIKYKDNTTWSHITIWNYEVVPATFDLKIHNELMHATMRLKSSFDDDFHVAPTSIRAMKPLLIFAIGHDTSDDAFQMATKFVEVKKTIFRFICEIDVNVTDISLRCWAGEQNVPSAHYNRNTVPDTDTEREPGSRDNPQGIDQPSGASSHPSEMEALRPGATQEFDLHATSREEETRKSGTPLGPGTRATPTPARRDPEADRDLLDASREGNMAAVKRILAAGRADVNCRGRGGMTPVMWAALRGHRDVVELLVSEGADVSLVDEDGDNILHCACLGGDVETVKCVLSLHVVDINSRGVGSRTPVMAAAGRGHRDVVDLLVKEGADVLLVDVYGNNILHLACRGGDVETVKCVLSLNVVDIDARNNAGQTAADVARRAGHKKVVKLL